MQPEFMDISPVEPVIDIGPPPPPPREPFWNYTDLLLVMGFVVASITLIVLVTGFLVAFNPGLRDDPGPLLLPVQVAFYGFIYLALYFTLKIRYGKPVFSSLGWRRTRFNLGIAVLGGAVLAFAISGLASLLHT